MKLPKISIVTPSFNAGKYIDETIHSVLSQDYPNYEYFVMDGGSTDNTVEILKKWDAQINDKSKFNWISEKDKGQTDAINKGLRRCSGDWFAYLNADDTFEPGVFSRIAPLMAENPESGVIYGNINVIYEGLGKEYDLLKVPEANIDFDSMLYGNQVFGPASFYNMKAFRRVGEFDETLYHWMDWDMYLRIAKIMPFKYVNLTVSTFRISPTMKSPSNPDNTVAYKRFQREAHQVSVRHGGKYFSVKWLEQFALYGRYKYYLRIIYKEESVIRHDKLDGAEINPYFMACTLLIHILSIPVRFILKMLS